uniref:Uncharacterized protein n=1 Tax=Polytomella parva TaxID=51329 RepID=A0A7S0YAQ9_9CHLO|mmetsp:Transcript_13921/g.24422  ORF Transcript_13921/g.24422 Transcript_13921/m.24422 type:complete len:241 (+) Transcript_13921:3-725(+)
MGTDGKGKLSGRLSSGSGGNVVNVFDNNVFEDGVRKGEREPSPSPFNNQGNSSNNWMSRSGGGAGMVGNGEEAPFGVNKYNYNSNAGSNNKYPSMLSLSAPSSSSSLSAAAENPNPNPNPNLNLNLNPHRFMSPSLSNNYVDGAADNGWYREESGGRGERGGDEGKNRISNINDIISHNNTDSMGKGASTGAPMGNSVYNNAVSASAVAKSTTKMGPIKQEGKGMGTRKEAGLNSLPNAV